jgi:hypothetical protein
LGSGCWIRNFIEYFSHQNINLKMTKIEKSMEYKMVLQDDKLIRFVDSKKHFFVKFLAYGFDLEEVLKFKNSFKVLQVITKANRIYEISHDSFFQYSFLNDQFGKKQLFIEVKYLTLVATKNNFVRISEKDLLKLKGIKRATKKKIIDLLSEAVDKL